MWNLLKVDALCQESGEDGNKYPGTLNALVNSSIQQDNSQHI
jgi:hypothetical protein